MNEEEDTSFLNVDLDVLSRTSLEPLVESFGKKVIVLRIGRWGRRYGARVEMADSHAFLVPGVRMPAVKHYVEALLLPK